MQDRIFAFIILHYQSLEYTQECIESVLRLDNQSQVRIVVVDNASPNGSGTLLMNRYGESDQIQILLNDTNAGFSRANNIGCQLARETWNPDFYIVVNNDVIFNQSDFLYSIEKEYEAGEFAVLGPDIYDITHKVHQSPIGKRIPTRKEALKTMLLNGVCHKALFISYPFISRYYTHVEASLSDVEDYNQRQENVWLMGACVILSRKYMDARMAELGKAYAFWPETNFYYEEALLGYYCKSKGLVTVYSPKLMVHHINGGATNSVKNNRTRIGFLLRNYYQASKIYLNTLKK